MLYLSKSMHHKGKERAMTSDPEKQRPGSNNQGEGDRESAGRYNEATREFVESGKVEEASERATGQDPQEAESSERAGRERAKEVDPAIHRDYGKPEKPEE
jgi:hypothetical protein